MAVMVEAGAFAGVISEALSDIAERVSRSVVLVFHRGGNGAGVIWRADGQIVTNSHVAREGRAEVVLADGRKLVGIVAARHPTRDLAILKVAAEDLPAIEVGDSSRVRPGQLAIAVGHPRGYRSAVTAGIVVASGQAATDEGPRTGDMLQADVALAPGNSGGPLVDAQGRVIGINTMVSGQLALAIPSQAVERFVAGTGQGQGTAYLGVAGIVVPLRRPDHAAGYLLTEIGEGTPADRAGLIVGDVIVAIGETVVIDQESVPAAIMRMRPGDAVTVRVLRGGEPRSFVVVPAERA
jgi:serine protease Do